MDDDILLSDDLMPNDSSNLYERDEDLTREINEERSLVTGAGSKLIDEILSWFDAAIDQADSISLLDPESKISLESQVIANQLLKSGLTSLRGSLQILRDEHIRD